MYGDVEPVFVEDEMEYLVFQKEKCPTSGREHFQTYVRFKARKRMQTVKNVMGNNAHVERARSDASTCIDYCTKLDTRVSPPKEFGEKPQRKRKVMEMIQTMSVQEILREEPKMWRSVRQLKEAKLVLSSPRTGPTETILLTGTTGTGKSKIASLIAQFLGEASWLDPELVWFDQFQGQALAVVDEFRGCKASMMLRLADRYPLQLPIKGSFVEWNPYYMILTSNLSFDEIFGGEDVKTKEALRRRITQYVVY
jgi:hypothetical protein